MNSIASSSVTIDTSLANVSTAINGYLNIPGNVRELRDDYDIDTKKEKSLLKKIQNRENRYLIKNLTGIHLNLRQIDDMHTQMNYDLTIKSFGAIEIVTIVLVVIMATISIPFFMMGMYTTGLMTLGAVLLYGLLMFLVICIPKSKKSMDKMFHRSILKELDEYCKIVAENEREKNNSGLTNYNTNISNTMGNNTSSNSKGMNTDWL